MASRQNGRAPGLRLQNRPVFLSDRRRRPGHAVALTYASAVQAASLTLHIFIFFLTAFLSVSSGIIASSDQEKSRR